MGFEPTSFGLWDRAGTNSSPTRYVVVWVRLELTCDQLLFLQGISLRRYQTLWWIWTESNCRHEDLQSSALPTELQIQIKGRFRVFRGFWFGTCITNPFFISYPNSFTTYPLCLQKDSNLRTRMGADLQSAAIAAMRYRHLFVIPLGLEPRTHTLKVYCSTNWAKRSIVVPQGFEPRFSGPKPDVLPLHHRTIFTNMSKNSCSFSELIYHKYLT